MNEYFATMADVHVSWASSTSPTTACHADGRDKIRAASIARLARMVGRDAAESTPRRGAPWRAGSANSQLRALHDAAVRVASALAPAAPVVGAGSGRWQVERLAARLERPFVDAATLFPARLTSPAEVSSAAPRLRGGIVLLDAA